MVRVGTLEGQSWTPGRCSSCVQPRPSLEGGAYRVDGHHRAVVRPGAQLHAAVLFIKGKVGDDDLTVAFEDGRGCPCDVASVVQEHFGELDNGKVAICTASGIKEERDSK